MVLNVSGRTDIVAFYSKWFMNRYEEGFVDVRNPFYPKLVNRIYFDDVDLILFCTKNPTPILNFLDQIKQPILFHVTITPYHKEIEPNVPDKKSVISSVRELSKIIGIDHIVVRYDPILVSNKYDIEYHKKAFEKLCRLLDGYVECIVISFLDLYKNVEKNKKVLQYRAFLEDDYKRLGLYFSKTAKNHHIRVQTCAEQRNLLEYGFNHGECLSHKLAFKLTGKTYPNWKARKNKHCKCVQMVDVGSYNSCMHLCKYCYANYNESEILENMKKHDPTSSLLIGSLDASDFIKIRRK